MSATTRTTSCVDGPTGVDKTAVQGQSKLEEKAEVRFVAHRCRIAVLPELRSSSAT